MRINDLPLATTITADKMLAIDKDATERATVQQVADFVLDQVPGGGAAADISYDHTESGLAATDVQGAIDELAAAPSGGGSGNFLKKTITADVTIDDNAAALGELVISDGITVTVADGKTLEVAKTSAGPIIGIGVPITTPEEIGVIYINTSPGGFIYISTGTSSSYNWAPIARSYANSGTIFFDDFNRVNGAPGNNWTTYADCSIAPTISEFKLGIAGTNQNYQGRAIRNAEGYNWAVNNIRLTGTVMMSASGANRNQAISISICSANISLYGGYSNIVPTATSGCTIVFNVRNYDVLSNSYNQRVIIYNGSSIVASALFTFISGTIYKYKIESYANSVYIKIWESSSSEPNVWTLSYIGAFSNSGGYIQTCFGLNCTGTDLNYIDDFLIEKI